jgi:hypothetical protein
MPQLGRLYTQGDPLAKSMGSLYVKIAADGFRADGPLNPGQRAGPGMIDPRTGQAQFLQEPETPGVLETYSPHFQAGTSTRGGAMDWRAASGVGGGLTGATMRGQGSPFGLAIQGLSAYSPGLAIAGSLLPMFLGPEAMQSDFFRQREMYYAGGNPQKIAAFRKAMGVLQENTAGDIGKSVKEQIVGLGAMLPEKWLVGLLEKGSEHSNSLKLAVAAGGGAAQFAANFRKDPSKFAGLLNMIDDKAIGKILPAVYQQLPEEGRQAVDMLMPRVAMSMQPIQDAVLMATGGVPDPVLLDKFFKKFQAWSDKNMQPGGAFNRDGVIIPKQAQLETMAFAQRYAPELSETELTNLASNSSKLMSTFGTKSYGQALLMAQQLGVSKYAKDPASLDRFLTHTQEMVGRGGKAIEDLAGASEIALKTGQNIHAVMASATHTAAISRAFAGLPNAAQLANTWAEAAGRLQTSKTGALFAAALQSPRLAAMANKARETGDPQLMQRVLTMARRDMATVQMSRRVTPMQVSNALSGNAAPALMAAGATMLAKRSGLNARDMKLLSDPKFVNDLVSGEKPVMGQLSKAAQRYIQNTGNSGMVALLGKNLMSKPYKQDKSGYMGDNEQLAKVPAQSQTAPKQQEVAQPSTAAAQNAAAKASAPTATPPAKAAPPQAQPAQPPAQTPTSQMTFDESMKPVGSLPGLDAQVGSTPPVPPTPAKPVADKPTNGSAMTNQIVDGVTGPAKAVAGAVVGKLGEGWAKAKSMFGK